MFTVAAIHLSHVSMKKPEPRQPGFYQYDLREEKCQTGAGVTQRTNIPAKLNFHMVFSFGCSIDARARHWPGSNSIPSNGNARWL